MFVSWRVGSRVWERTCSVDSKDADHPHWSGHISPGESWNQQLSVSLIHLGDALCQGKWQSNLLISVISSNIAPTKFICIEKLCIRNRKVTCYDSWSQVASIMTSAANPGTSKLGYQVVNFGHIVPEKLTEIGVWFSLEGDYIDIIQFLTYTHRAKMVWCSTCERPKTRQPNTIIFCKHAV